MVRGDRRQTRRLCVSGGSIGCCKWSWFCLLWLCDPGQIAHLLWDCILNCRMKLVAMAAVGCHRPLRQSTTITHLIRAAAIISRSSH